MEILSDKTVITRKNHKCHCCSQIVSKGSQMRVQVNVYDGIGTFRWCLTCDKLTTDYEGLFINYGEMIFEENCVLDAMQDYKVKTPEELLQKFQESK